MYNIQTLNKISQLGLDQLDSKEFVISTECDNPDGILVRSADMHQMELGSNLRAIARAGAGTNNIPIDKCSESGIVVFNTPGANANAVKELVICALLLASRDVIRGIKWAWNLTDADGDVEKLVEKQKSQFVGPELMGKNLGVIGLGAVGVKVANAALKLGMNVYGYDPYLSVQNAIDLNHAVQVVDLKTVYAMSDYITIHSPLLPSTKGMINEPSLDSMRQGVRIINLARGGLVDDQDMLAAIASGKVARYVTDFPNNTLVGQEGVFCCKAGQYAWQKLAAVPEPLVQPVAFAAGGKLYLGGGFNPETLLAPDAGRCLDLHTLEWGSAPAVPDGGTVVGASGATLPDGRLLVVGGVNRAVFERALRNTPEDRIPYLSQEPSWYRFRKEVWAFDPVKQQWDILGTFDETALAGAGVAVGRNGIVVTGGECKPGVRSPRNFVLH